MVASEKGIETFPFLLFSVFHSTSFRVFPFIVFLKYSFAIPCPYSHAFLTV
jgi:hypothetical protein